MAFSNSVLFLNIIPSDWEKNWWAEISLSLSRSITVSIVRLVESFDCSESIPVMGLFITNVELLLTVRGGSSSSITFTSCSPEVMSLPVDCCSFCILVISFDSDSIVSSCSLFVFFRLSIVESCLLIFALYLWFSSFA